MTKILSCSTIAVMLMLGAGTAAAGGSQGTVGVGAEVQLSGEGGMSLNYDAGQFHAGGYLYFDDEDGPDNTDVGLGGRFFWHVHSSPMSDFSVGGNLGLRFDNEGPDNSATLLYLEPAIQIRAFIAGNVALSFTSGIVVGLADADGDGVALTGQINALGGVHYYFF